MIIHIKEVISCQKDDFILHYFKFIYIRAPFDASLLVLASMVVIIAMNWSENFGDSQADLKQSFLTAWTSIRTG